MKIFCKDWHIGENMGDGSGFLLIDYYLKFHSVCLNEEDILLNEKIDNNTFNSVIKEINNLIDTKLDIIEYHHFYPIYLIL